MKPPTHMCDRCGAPLEKGMTHYIAQVQVYAAPTLEIDLEDLEEHSQGLKQAADACAEMSEEELMKDVYVEMKFDLCRPCQREYLKHPLRPL